MTSQYIIIIFLNITLFLGNLHFNFSYKVEITSYCDDYCTPSKDNKKFKKQTFKHELNLDTKTFDIILRNDEGEFGLAIEVSFGSFKYTTNDITNWKFGKPGESCADIQPQLVDKNSFSKFALIRNNGGILDYKSCTITLPRICKNENYYMPKNQESFEFDVFDFLNVSPVTKIIKKRVYINFITIPTKGQLKKHNLFSSKDVKIGETFSDQENIYYYKINDDFYQDPIEFHLKESSKGTIFDTCTFNIVICGEHCIRCVDNISLGDGVSEPMCNRCQANFAMKVDEFVNCYEITKELDGYYYDKETDKFEHCYETCSTCSSRGNSLYNKCNTCKDRVGEVNILSKVKVNEAKNKFSYNCGFSTCEDLGMYRKKPGNIECVSDCEHEEYIFEDTCVSECNGHKKYEKKLEGDPAKTIKMCVKNCQEHSAYLKESDKCVSECVKYIVIENEETKCQVNCQESNIYENAGQYFCVKICPSDKHYIKISTLECVEQCGVNEYEMEYSSGTIACVTKCSPPYIYQYSSGTPKKCLTECPTDAPFINTVDNTCVTEEICKEQSLFIYATKFECYKNCPKHLFSKEEKDGIKSKLCKDSCDNNEYKHTESKQCFGDNCPEQYPLKDVDSHECLLFCGEKFQTVPGNECVVREKCLETYEFIDDDNNICLKTCQDNPFDTHRLSEGSKCVSKCSEFTSPNDEGKCLHELYVIETSETTGVITIPFDQTLIWVDKYVTEYNDLHLHITGDGFNMQVFSTEEPLSKNNKMTYCDLDKCINKLKEKERIHEQETLYIVKFDIIDNNHTIDQVQYKIYNKNGKQLSMNACDGLSTTVTYPFKEILIGDLTEEEEQNEISTNFELALAMFSKHDINIYDSSEPFFNDICFIYKNENGSEMTLQDRRIKYYQNFTFCEDNCVYKSLDFENLTAKCDCKIKTQFTDFLQEWPSVQENNEPFVSGDFSTQYLIYKCYKLFFKFDYLHYNIGFWSGVILIFFEILFIILLPCLELKIMRSRLNSYKEQKEKANPPVKPKKKNKVTFNNDKLNLNSDCKTTQTLFNKIQTYSESDPYENYYFNGNTSFFERNSKLNRLPFQLNNKGSQEHSNSMRELDFYNYICFNENKIIDDYPFQIGKLIDRRSFCKVYFEKLLQHNLFFCVFSNKSLHDFVSIKLSLVFTDISLSLGLCCLFYSEQIITDKYVYDKVNILCHPLRFVFSVLIEYTVIKLIKYIHVSSFIFEYLLYEIHNWFFLGEFIKKILCRISSYATFLFIIELVFSLTIWLYMTLFCIIYSNSQMHWFISGWVNLAFTYGVSVCFIFILALFRFISVKYKSQTFYNIELKLRMLI